MRFGPKATTLIRAFQAALAVVLVNTLLASAIDSSPYTYHVREGTWWAKCAAALLFFALTLRYAPILSGICIGSVTALMIDHAAHGHVENYLAIGIGEGILTNVADIAYLIGSVAIFLRLAFLLTKGVMTHGKAQRPNA